MGNTEMTKYMAAGAFADITSSKATFDNSANWLKGLAASGVYGGKLYGVPYYAGSRVVTYRTDAYAKAGIKKLPTSLAQFTVDAKKLAAKNASVKGFSPGLHRGHRLVLRDELRLRLRRLDREDVEAASGSATSTRTRSIAGLTAYKNFWAAVSKASKTSDENHPAPYDVYSQGGAASIIGPGWFSCCVGDKFKTTTAQFVMPSHTAGQPMPGFLGGSDLAIPATSGNKALAVDWLKDFISTSSPRKHCRRRATSRTPRTCSARA